MDIFFTTDAEYFTYDEAMARVCEPSYSYYVDLFKRANIICSILAIRMPDFCITEGPILQEVDGTALYAVLHAFTTTLLDDPKASNDRIIISLEGCRLYGQYLGTLAHELRHVWQSQTKPLLYKAGRKKINSVNRRAEIDADGFAIWYLAYRLNISFDAAGELVCPYEHHASVKAYAKRIKKAKVMERKYKYPAKNSAGVASKF